MVRRTLIASRAADVRVDVDDDDHTRRAWLVNTRTGDETPLDAAQLRWAFMYGLPTAVAEIDPPTTTRR